MPHPAPKPAKKLAHKSSPPKKPTVGRFCTVKPFLLYHAPASAAPCTESSEAEGVGITVGSMAVKILTCRAEAVTKLAYGCPRLPCGTRLANAYADVV